MRRAGVMLVVPAVLAISAAAWGGWAIITVDDLPEYAVAGQPLALTFTVRQHGVDPLAGLKPAVIARLGRTELRTVAQPGRARGTYTASVMLPRPGDWDITLESGFNSSRNTLLPMTAVAPGATPPTLPAAERGRRLFVAKGCVTCHVHKAVPARESLDAPELTHRRFDPDHLSRFLANPTFLGSRGDWRMPDLALREPEIADLVTFLNATSQARM